jgi:hypothetical protein
MVGELVFNAKTQGPQRRKKKTVEHSPLFSSFALAPWRLGVEIGEDHRFSGSQAPSREQY